MTPSRLLFFMLAALAPIAARPASASPITYDFTGTLRSPEPGEPNQFSGSFTIDGDVTPNPPDGFWEHYEVDEKGSVVSLTLNIGGQTYKYENNANTRVEFTVGTSPSWHGEGPRQEETILSALDRTGGASNMPFWMAFYAPASAQDLRNLRTLDFLPGTGSAFIYTPAYSGEGSFTSVTLVQTPEPGALAVFALVGAAAFWKLRRS